MGSFCKAAASKFERHFLWCKFHVQGLSKGWENRAMFQENAKSKTILLNLTEKLLPFIIDVDKKRFLNMYVVFTEIHHWKKVIEAPECTCVVSIETDVCFQVSNSVVERKLRLLNLFVDFNSFTKDTSAKFNSRIYRVYYSEHMKKFIFRRKKLLLLLLRHISSDRNKQKVGFWLHRTKKSKKIKESEITEVRRTAQNIWE